MHTQIYVHMYISAYILSGLYTKIMHLTYQDNALSHCTAEMNKLILNITCHILLSFFSSLENGNKCVSFPKIGTLTLKITFAYMYLTLKIVNITLMPQDFKSPCISSPFFMYFKKGIEVAYNSACGALIYGQQCIYYFNKLK